MPTQAYTTTCNKPGNGFQAKTIKEEDQMSIAGINLTRSGVKTKLSSRDNYERKIKNQISALEDKMEAISNDEETPAEEKKKIKQAAQEQLDNLNQELREYEIRKRQEEAEKKREAIKAAQEAANSDPAETESEEGGIPFFEGLSGEEAGVMITLSATKEQIAGMVRLRTNLEGKQRTASTEEEKAELQKKINRVSKGIGQQIITAKDTLTDFRKNYPKNKEDTKKNAPKPEQKKEEVFWADTKPVSAENTVLGSKQSNSGKNKLLNPNIKYVIK